MNASSRLGLGRLERVGLREAWQGEATDFTPWLALSENITLLGNAIGIELEVESQEKDVGPFRADILCRDLASGDYVLVENQLERTDHTHLGQLLTYAAGLDAVTVVWVAARFVEEHRAVLDWLNENTSRGLNFFGVEIELWRIGGSDMVPKFNIVSKPNDWSRVVKERAATGSGELTATNRLNLDFWAQFKGYLEERSSSVRLSRASKEMMTSYGVGRTGFALVAWNSMRTDRPGITVDGDAHHSGVYLRIGGPDAKAHYGLIDQRHRDVVEERLSPLGPVRWLSGPPESNSISIALSWPSTPADPKTWPELNDWMAASLEAMDDLFRPIVKDLDASDYVDPTKDADAVGVGAAARES